MLFWSDKGCQLGDDGHPRKDGHLTRIIDATPDEASRVRQLLFNIQYTLVSDDLREKLSRGPNSRIFEFYRLVMILYSLTVLNEHAPSTAFGKQIGSRFRSSYIELIQKPHNRTAYPDIVTSQKPPLPFDFRLWSLFLAICALITTECDINDWLLLTFVELASLDPSIRDWADLRARLSQYLWIPSFHDSISQWLWFETTDLRSNQKHMLAGDT